MNNAPSLQSTLVTRRLRTLTVDPRVHPRGQGYLSAASGLVCLNGRAYVIADDEHHLAVFRDRRSPGELHRLFPGDLPRPMKARKRRKPDLEALLLLPQAASSAGAALVAFGSGSRPNRDIGVVIPLNADGEPCARVQRFDLKPLFEPLRAALGEINIEGALLIGDALVLLNRAVAGRSDNAAARYPLRDLRAVIEGHRTDINPASIRRYSLGAVDGVELGFTDGAALPNGGWVFSAVAERRDDSVSDGPCTGSAVGVIAASGELLAMHRLVPAAKIEGIDVLVHRNTMTLCMVTDSDDPAQSSQLLLAHL